MTQERDPAWDLYVFREAKRDVRPADLARALAAELEASPRRLASTLVRAGEIESALADAGIASARDAERITDALASALVGDRAPPSDLAHAAKALETKERARLSPPESFAYYGAHPLDFADAARALAPTLGAHVSVIGLRSIGTTLSAVVRAELAARGVDAERATVRPSGDPLDKRTRIDERVAAWLRARAAIGSTYVVVDEGPGMSGSSLLSAAEAIEGEGVAPARIVLLGTRACDPDTLRAEDAGRRFRRFRFALARIGGRVPTDARTRIDRGAWRSALFGDASSWPAAYPPAERAKHLSPDGARLFRFEGIGRYGDDALARAAILGETGACPRAIDAGDGFVAYDVARGPRARPSDADPERVRFLADYCALRARALRVDDADAGELSAMLDHNARAVPGAPRPLTLEVRRPVVADARMVPHAFVITPRGLVKVDAVSHGDDHCFPGRVDVAWDLAGAIVEWRLSPALAAELVSRYERRSGDRVAERLAPYLDAYALYRYVFARFGATVLRGSVDERLHGADAARYAARLGLASPRIGRA